MLEFVKKLCVYAYVAILNKKAAHSAAFFIGDLTRFVAIN
jgi:hypothetical protein